MRLMTSVLFLASITTLTGCPGAECDSASSGDSCGGTKTTPTDDTVTIPVVDVTVTAWNITSDGATTTITVSAGGDAATAEWEMIQTGDAGFNCGPDKGVVCGVWSEGIFDLAGGSGSFSTALGVVTAAGDQVNGSTTLFDSADELNGLTIYTKTTSGDGATTDCAVGGHKPDYYGSLGCDTI